MGFYDAFFGSDQSLYTAYSIIAAIIAICLTILLTATDVPVGNRILIVLFVIITLIPSVFLTLFELTCIVTGGTEPNRWWCHAFAWILAAFIIIYCIIVVIVSLVSLFNYNKAIDTVNSTELKYKISNNDSNNYAKDIIYADEQYNKEVEKFNVMYNNNERFTNEENPNAVGIPDLMAVTNSIDNLKKGMPAPPPSENSPESSYTPPTGGSSGPPSGPPAGYPSGGSSGPPTADYSSKPSEFFNGNNKIPSPIPAISSPPPPTNNNEGFYVDTPAGADYKHPTNTGPNNMQPTKQDLLNATAVPISVDAGSIKLQFTDLGNNKDDSIVDDKYAAFIH